MDNHENQTGPILISVVVACRNEAKHIREFLNSVLAQDFDSHRWEAIIADGLSNDGTRAVLAEYCSKHPQLRHLDNPLQIVSTGLNAAIRAACGEIIILMDALTIYAPDYCVSCVQTLQTTGADNVGGPARTKATGTCDVQSRQRITQDSARVRAFMMSTMKDGSIR
jgi:succinoglycan biosynthesis protein ExoA